MLANRPAPRSRRIRVILGGEIVVKVCGHVLRTLLPVTVLIGGALMGSIRALVAIPAAAAHRRRLLVVTVGRLDTR